MSPSTLAAHHRRLEAMYAGAPVNQTIPSRVVVAEGGAEVHMEVSEAF